MEVHLESDKIWLLEYPNFEEREIIAQVYGRLREQLRPLHNICSWLGAKTSAQWFLGFDNRKAFCPSYLSLLVRRFAIS